MKNSELIGLLSKLDPEMEVCVFDCKRNIEEDSGEGTGAGVYTKFNVYQMDNENLPKDGKPWIAIEFLNSFIEDENQKFEQS